MEEEEKRGKPEVKVEGGREQASERADLRT